MRLLALSLIAGILAPLAGCGQGIATAARLEARPQAAAAVRAATTALSAGAVTADEPLERRFTVAQAGEALLDLEAAVPGADWERVGREAATVRIFLDDRYNQDVILHQGEARHTYRLALGAIAPGEHRLRFERIAEYSAAGLVRIDMSAATFSIVPPESPDHAVFAHAPILYTRPDAHRNDTPFLMMADVQALPDESTIIRYTAVMSNEDGGTDTTALMARWGRTVDIDWAYAIHRDLEGRPKGATFQGFLHMTRPFKGRYEDRHPLMQVSSENNIFSDEARGPLRLRLAPHFRLEPLKAAREEVLDAHPWAYPLMAKELFRERKASKDYYTPVADPARGMIGDPRRFLFVEFRQVHHGRGLGVEVKLKGREAPHRSDRGDGGLTAARSGWCRVAVELPSPARLEELEEIAVVGAGGGSAVVTHVRKVIALDAGFQPTFLPIRWEGEGLVRSDEDRVVVFRP